jgi:hypothetical protein
MSADERDHLRVELDVVYRGFSTAMFGSVFDVNLLALSSGVKPIGRMLDKALQITIDDPRTNGIGLLLY